MTPAEQIILAVIAYLALWAAWAWVSLRREVVRERARRRAWAIDAHPCGGRYGASDWQAWESELDDSHRGRWLA